MSIFSKLFRSKPAARSRLETFLSELTPDAIRNAASNGADEATRVATAISLLVLSRAHVFATQTLAEADKLSRKLPGPPVPHAAFDVIAFEVAAFTHYSLLAPYLSKPDLFEDDFEEDGDEDSEDPYFQVLLSATHLSAGLVHKFTDFGLSENFFINRATSYGLKGRGGNLFDEFETILSQSLEGGTPKAGLRGRLLLDLSLGMSLKIGIASYCTHMLPAMATAARNAFEKAEELGWSD